MKGSAKLMVASHYNLFPFSYTRTMRTSDGQSLCFRGSNDLALKFSVLIPRHYSKHGCLQNPISKVYIFYSSLYDGNTSYCTVWIFYNWRKSEKVLQCQYTFQLMPMMSPVGLLHTHKSFVSAPFSLERLKPNSGCMWYIFCKKAPHETMFIVYLRTPLIL